MPGRFLEIPVFLGDYFIMSYPVELTIIVNLDFYPLSFYPIQLDSGLF